MEDQIFQNNQSSSFLKKIWHLLKSPSSSRTFNLLVMFLIVAAVPLTVYVAQQRQETRQQAAETASWGWPTPSSGSSGTRCLSNQNCPQGSQCVNYHCVATSPTSTPPTPTPTRSPSVSPTATPSVSVSSTPTPTVPQGQAGLSLEIDLPGIGKNANQNPLHPQKDVTVCLYSLNTDPTGDYKCTKGIKKTGTVTYNSQTGSFTNGNFSLGSISPSQYQVFVKINGYLRKRIPQVLNIVTNQVTQTPKISLVVGDINN
ncbi:MAG: hypothetical protein Q8P80_00875 [Candidatus Levybacteria bacterium]|nr:hypothetical protein [Candidatus Levybacteria bacterium]